MDKRIMKKDQVGWVVGQSVGLDAVLVLRLAQALAIDPHPPLALARTPDGRATRGGRPPRTPHIPVFPTPFSLFGTRSASQSPNRDFGPAANGVGGVRHA